MAPETFMFEVQRRTGSDIPRNVHVGYMNILFRTKEDAINYFEKQGRSKILTECGVQYGYDDVFRYIIRNYHNELFTIEPFDLKDACKTVVDRDETGKLLNYEFKTYVPTD